MSTQVPGAPIAASEGLPFVNQTRMPASVRNGSPAVKQAYVVALSFEEMLVQQLSQGLVESSGLNGGESTAEGSSSGTEDSTSQGAGAGSLVSLLPQTLTEAVMRHGGLGLATQLMRGIDPASAGSTKGGGSSRDAGSKGGVSA